MAIRETAVEVNGKPRGMHESLRGRRRRGRPKPPESDVLTRRDRNGGGRATLHAPTTARLRSGNEREQRWLSGARPGRAATLRPPWHPRGLALPAGFLARAPRLQHLLSLGLDAQATGLAGVPADFLAHAPRLETFRPLSVSDLRAIGDRVLAYAPALETFALYASRPWATPSCWNSIPTPGTRRGNRFSGCSAHRRCPCGTSARVRRWRRSSGSGTRRSEPGTLPSRPGTSPACSWRSPL